MTILKSKKNLRLLEIDKDKFINDYKDIIQYADDNNGHMGEHLPQRYEMRLSNKCNLACRMCSPENSTLLAKEVVNNKEFNHLKIHTQYSICEGALRTSELAKYCKENKHPYYTWKR